MGPSTPSCSSSSLRALPSNTPVQACQRIARLHCLLHHPQKACAHFLRRNQNVSFSRQPLRSRPRRRSDARPLSWVRVWFHPYAKACWYQLLRNSILCLHFHLRDSDPRAGPHHGGCTCPQRRRAPEQMGSRYAGRGRRNKAEGSSGRRQVDGGEFVGPVSTRVRNCTNKSLRRLNCKEKLSTELGL